MAKIGDVVVGLRANTAQFTGAMAGAQRSVGMLSSSMMKLGAVGLGVGGLVAMFASARRAAVDFEREMVKIITLVGVAEGQVKGWGKELRKLSVQVGRGPVELSRALFAVTSAGIRSADALRIVELAAKASAIGLGDTATIARTVTAAMTAYEKAGLSAAKATDILVATIREGNLEADSLAGPLGRVMGIAAQVGISFADANAFIATFTRLGVSAEEAVTSLRTIIISFLKPQEAARKELKRLGLDVDQLRKKIAEDGLAPALVDLAAILGDNQDAIAAVIPEARALSGFLGVAAAQSETYLQVTKNINEELGITERGFLRTRETGYQAGSEIKAVWEDLKIFLGGPVLTTVAAVGDAFATIIDKMAGRDRRTDLDKVIEQFQETVDAMLLLESTAQTGTTTYKWLGVQLEMLQSEYDRLTGKILDTVHAKERLDKKMPSTATPGAAPIGVPRAAMVPIAGADAPLPMELIDTWNAKWKEHAGTLQDAAAGVRVYSSNMDMAVVTTNKMLDNIERLTMALANLARGLRFNFLGGLMGGIFGFIRGGPIGAGIGAAGGLVNVPGLRAEDFNIQPNVSTVQLSVAPAVNPFEQARDAAWLSMLAESNRALGANGYRFEVVG